MRISDWSSDVCSSDLNGSLNFGAGNDGSVTQVSGANSTATVTGTVYGDVYSEASGSSFASQNVAVSTDSRDAAGTGSVVNSSNNSFNVSSTGGRSEEHTSELQSLMRISYAVFFLKKKKKI